MASNFSQFFVEKGFDRKTANELVNLFVEKISKDLDTEGSCLIHGFGKFKMRTIPATTRRNPQTGELFKGVEKKTVRFKISNKYRNNIKG